MKAAVVDEFGVPPVYRDFPEPTAGPDHVIAEVVAASLKNLDRGLVAGTHYGSAGLVLPLVAGVDGVARLPEGRLVYTRADAPYGLMAERAPVDTAAAVTVPDGLDPVLAAAIPNPGLSAWFSLEYAAQLQPGQTVVVLGATGVTGAIAVQLAKARFGAGHVIAVGRNAERLDWLRKVGADATLNLGTDDIAEQLAAQHQSHPFDAVIDYLWGPPAEAVLATLTNNHLAGKFHSTQYVQVGSMAGTDITLPAAVLRSAGVQIRGVGIGSVPAEALARVGSELLPALFAMAADGSLAIDVDTRALRDVTAVWSATESSGSRVVLVP